mmetsp:Transcript_41647/g.83542  ORF Transcript_41647/g.83542 Transcript_41647/m.83542 type:complete len:356 (+) Transcript_41647:291-1358(+)
MSQAAEHRCDQQVRQGHGVQFGRAGAGVEAVLLAVRRRHLCAAGLDRPALSLAHPLSRRAPQQWQARHGATLESDQALHLHVDRRPLPASRSLCRHHPVAHTPPLEAAAAVGPQYHLHASPRNHLQAAWQCVGRLASCPDGCGCPQLPMARATPPPTAQAGRSLGRCGDAPRGHPAPLRRSDQGHSLRVRGRRGVAPLPLARPSALEPDAAVGRREVHLRCGLQPCGRQPGRGRGRHQGGRIRAAREEPRTLCWLSDRCAVHCHGRSGFCHSVARNVTLEGSPAVYGCDQGRDVGADGVSPLVCLPLSLRVIAARHSVYCCHTSHTLPPSGGHLETHGHSEASPLRNAPHHAHQR